MQMSSKKNHSLLPMLQATIELASEGIVVLDHKTGAVLSHNRNFIELFNLNIENIKQKSIMNDLVTKLNQPQELINILDAIKQAPFQENKHEFSLNELNSFKIIECRSCPIIIEQNGLDIVIGRAWYFKDITDIRSQEKRMIESAKMAALGELAGGIAHEINNPMTMIKNYSKKVSRIIEGNPDDNLQQLQKAALSIHKSTERVINIISGLQNISKNEGIMSYETTSLSAIICEVRDLSQERINKNGITLNIDINSNNFIHCNRVQIYQVLINLVNNAVDAIVESGVTEKWIRISQSTHNGQVSVFVQDSGPGVNQQTVEKIFNPFFSTKDVDKGTGLGLSLSKEIIQNHKGDLSYEKQEGTSTFKAILPLAS
jgi:signal transduction histidine kinase